MKTLLLFVPSAVAIALLMWARLVPSGPPHCAEFFHLGISIWCRAGKCDSLDHSGIAGRRDALCIHAAGSTNFFSVLYKR